MNLKLSKIEIDGLQARAETCDKTVEEYAAAFLDGAKFPPVIVFHDGVLYFLADGLHRCLAATKADLVDINADIRKGTRADARWFSSSANQSHGLRRTNADKEKAVLIALEEKPESSDRAIAKHVGVDDHTVARIRKSTEIEVRKSAPESEKPPQKRVGTDGKRYPVPEQKKKVPPKPKKSAPQKPVQEMDKTGLRIPQKLLPLWHRSDEPRKHLRALSELKSALKEAQKGKDELYKEVNFSLVLSSLEQAWSALETAIPYAVCPTCQGKSSDGCKLCLGRGFISEFRWDKVVTKEAKEMREKAKEAQ